MLQGFLHYALHGIRRPRAARSPCQMLPTERRAGVGWGGRAGDFSNHPTSHLPIISALQLSQGLTSLSKKKKKKKRKEEEGELKRRCRDNCVGLRRPDQRQVRPGRGVRVRHPPRSLQVRNESGGRRGPARSPGGVQRLSQTGFWKSTQFPRTRLPAWALRGGSCRTRGSSSGEVGAASGLARGHPRGQGGGAPEGAEVGAGATLPASPAGKPAGRGVPGGLRTLKAWQ